MRALGAVAALINNVLSSLAQAVEGMNVEIPAELVQSPFMKLIGCYVLRLEKDEAQLAMKMGTSLCNRQGNLHGGAIFGLVDTAMGVACSMFHGFDKTSVTLDSKINYIRAVVEGEVVCIARVVHGGRRTLVVEAEVVQNNKIMAKALATFLTL